MGNFNASLTAQWASSNGEVIGGTVSDTADAQVQPMDVPIPANSTNLLINIQIGEDELQQLFLLARDVDMTIYTNEASTGSPAQTIPLKADVPTTYSRTRDGSDQLISTDVTKIYVTCGAGGGTLTIRGLIDPTP